MKSAEIELPEEDYEIVPLAPLRRLEKRIESIETTKTTQNLERFVDKIIDMTELNQKIVDGMIKSNQALREDVGVLIGKMDNLSGNLNDFINLIKTAGEQDIEATSKEAFKDAIKPFVDQVTQIAKTTQEGNTVLAESLENINKRLKRIQTTSETAKSVSNILARRGVGSQPQPSIPPLQARPRPV